MQECTQLMTSPELLEEILMQQELVKVVLTKVSDHAAFKVEIDKKKRSLEHLF